MYLLRPDTLQDVLVQASLLLLIATQGRVDCPVAEAELEMPFMVSCDLNLELYDLSRCECRDRPRRHVEK